MQFPIYYFENNLILNRSGEAWAVYRLEPWHYEHLGHATKMGLLWRLSRLFWELEEIPGQVLMVPRLLNPLEQLRHLSEAATGPMAPDVRRFCDAAQSQVSTVADGFGYEHYLALRLPPAERLPVSGPAYWKSIWAEPKRLVEQVLGLAAPRLADYELDAYLAREEMIFGRLGRVCKATRVDETTIAGLIRRGFWRGLGEPKSRLGWSPDALVRRTTGGDVEIRPLASELQTLTEGELDLRNPRCVGITQVTAEGEVTGYTAFGFVSDLPDEMLFPGCEWLYGLQDLTFPVEVSLRWRNLPYEDALAATRKKRLELVDQDGHNRRAGEALPLSLIAAQEQVALLEQDLKERRFPTALASVCLAVSARTHRELWERVQQVRAYLSAFQIGYEVPAGDQLQALLETIPGSPAAAHQDYVHRVPPEVLAGSMFLGTASLGDPSGTYIGRMGMLRRPVYFDPTLPPALNRSASIAFLGTLGGGKSFAANLLTYHAILFGGAHALILDPKGERSNWAEDLPELAGQMRVITLGAQAADRGKLDPFILGEGLDEEGKLETGNLAVSILSFLAGVSTSDPRFLTLMAAVEDVAREPKPALTKVIHRLREMGQGDPAAAELAQFYSALSRRAFAHLIFGQGDEKGLELSHRVNILQLQHLVMPPAGKERADLTLDEMLSMALMHAVTAFATQFTRRDRETFKIVLLDEAWALMASSQGRALVTNLLRTGRALNNAVYLISQNVRDLLDETVRNNVGLKFIFRSGDQGEVEQLLSFLNLEADGENASVIRQLETGQALIQDLYGRVGLVSLDPVLPHLRRAFDSRPPGLRREVAG